MSQTLSDIKSEYWLVWFKVIRLFADTDAEKLTRWVSTAIDSLEKNIDEVMTGGMTYDEWQGQAEVIKSALANALASDAATPTALESSLSTGKEIASNTASVLKLAPYILLGVVVIVMMSYRRVA